MRKKLEIIIIGIEKMSNIENERILENLYEKYLDLGYDKDLAQELAFEEFCNLETLPLRFQQHQKNDN